jgi:hypothetical protein
MVKSISYSFKSLDSEFLLPAFSAKFFALPISGAIAVSSFLFLASAFHR